MVENLVHRRDTEFTECFFKTTGSQCPRRLGGEISEVLFYHRDTEFAEDFLRVLRVSAVRKGRDVAV